MNTIPSINILDAMSREMVKTGLSELYLTASQGFGLLHGSDEINLVLAEAQKELDYRDAHEIIKAHWQCSDALNNFSPMFVDGSTGLIESEGLCIEISVRQIGSSPKKFRLLFSRLDTPNLYRDTQTRLKELADRVTKLENEQSSENRVIPL